MFTRITETETQVKVDATRLGLWLHWLTLGYIKPRLTLNRNFGGAAEDNKTLFVGRNVCVNLNGNLAAPRILTMEKMMSHVSSRVGKLPIPSPNDVPKYQSKNSEGLLPRMVE